MNRHNFISTLLGFGLIGNGIIQFFVETYRTPGMSIIAAGVLLLAYAFGRHPIL